SQAEAKAQEEAQARAQSEQAKTEAEARIREVEEQYRQAETRAQEEAQARARSEHAEAEARARAAALSNEEVKRNNAETEARPRNGEGRYQQAWAGPQSENDGRTSAYPRAQQMSGMSGYSATQSPRVEALVLALKTHPKLARYGVIIF